MNRARKIESDISRLLNDRWRGATPGLCLRVHQGGQTLADLRFGETFAAYDWASLTKVVLTLTVFMKAYDDGRIRESDLDTPIAQLLPNLVPHGSPGAALTLRHVLTHTSNLSKSLGLFAALPEGASPIEVEQLARRLLSEKLSQTVPTARSSYSELGFLVLGYSLEAWLGETLPQIWKRHRADLGFEETDFHPGNRAPRPVERYAPTENCPLRGRLIQGEVHHPDAWAMGGVTWLAGLLGPMDDLSKWALGLRAAMSGERTWIISPQTARRFAAPALPAEFGSVALGFMMPKAGRREGQSYYLSAGSKLSPASIGHTGFTGPMHWYDPSRDLTILTLTNRTFPTASNETYFSFRGFLHDCVVEVLELNP